MRELIPFMALMKEVFFILDIHLPKSEVICELFEDNQSCIAVAESKKFPPRKKYIAIKYHNFQSFIQNNIIQICYTDTREQKADIFTNPLNEFLFVYI